MPLPAPQQLRFDRLLLRHFIWHLWVGAVAWAGLVVAVNLYQYAQERRLILHEDFYASSRADSLRSLAGNTLETTFLLLFGLLPAVLGGLVRYPLLAALSRRARTAGELVWQSLALFELWIFRLALLPWPIAYMTFGVEIFIRKLIVTTLLSLPWLVSTGLASRQLAAALFAAAPPAGQRAT